MPDYSSDTIRNISLVGQSGCGKTTLVEALMRSAGAISNTGTVARGNTISDFDPLEKQYKHSLSSSVVSFDSGSVHINLIDTPGIADFIGLSIASFPAVETVAVVIDAAKGIEPVTRRMLEWAAARELCRMIIVNHIDAEDVDLPSLVDSIREEFGSECLPINLPAKNASEVVDCFYQPDGEADFSSVSEAHGNIIDQVVEVDEAMMELYLEQGQELAPEQLHNPFEQALREGHLVPICFTSALLGAGVPELLSLCETLMPNPLEGNPRPFQIGQGDSVADFAATPDPDKHVVAHAFKVMADPFVGKVGVLRVHQGTITKDSQLFVGDGRKPFKVAHLFKLQGKEQIAVDKGIPGDICAVAKVDDVHFDAVLHDSHEEDYLQLRPLPFPVPIYGLAITPHSRNDQQRISNALERLVEEDPCLALEHDTQQNELVLHGLGELHLRIVLEQMKARFNVDADTRPPRIPYRETISARADAQYRHKKQTGGAGQFGEVWLRVAPLEPGGGFVFKDEVKGGTIPGQFIPAVEKGVRQAMDEGAIAGYPLQDIEVTVYDGKHHSVDSKEVAFVAAGKRAFQLAVGNAKPLVLEPVVSLELVVPSNAMGGVSGDLNSRRGQLMGTKALPGGDLTIEAQAPLSELSDYASKLKSLTGGHGSYTLVFSHYQPTPHDIQVELAAQWTRREDEDL